MCCRWRVEAVRNSCKFFNTSLLNFHLEVKKAIYMLVKKISLGWIKENCLFFIVQKLGQPFGNKAPSPGLYVGLPTNYEW